MDLLMIVVLVCVRVSKVMVGGREKGKKSSTGSVS